MQVNIKRGGAVVTDAHNLVGSLLKALNFYTRVRIVVDSID